MTSVLRQIVASLALFSSLQFSESLEAQTVQDRNAVLTHAEVPKLSKEVRDAKLDAIVEFSIVIGVDGRPKELNLIEGNDFFVDAVRNAILKRRYRPAQLGGTKIEAKRIVRYHFLPNGHIDGIDIPLDAANPSPKAPPLPKGLYRVGNGVSPPRPLGTPDPQYTDRARQSHEHGAVFFTIIVTEEGQVAQIEFVKADRGIGKDLIDNARVALQDWKFSPALRDGSPVAVQVGVAVNFHLQ